MKCAIRYQKDGFGKQKASDFSRSHWYEDKCYTTTLGKLYIMEEL